MTISISLFSFSFSSMSLAYRLLCRKIAIFREENEREFLMMMVGEEEKGNEE